MEVAPDLQYGLLDYIAHLTSENYAAIPGDLIRLGFVPKGQVFPTIERLNSQLLYHHEYFTDDFEMFAGSSYFSRWRGRGSVSYSTTGIRFCGWWILNLEIKDNVFQKMYQKIRWLHHMFCTHQFLLICNGSSAPQLAQGGGPKKVQERMMAQV